VHLTAIYSKNHAMICYICVSCACEAIASYSSTRVVSLRYKLSGHRTTCHAGKTTAPRRHIPRLVSTLWSPNGCMASGL
jgi:hypothetical protein